MSNTEVFPLLREQLVRLAHYRLGDQHAAEDVAQETLTRIIESRQTFTSTAHLTGWAVTTTKNLCADHHRQRQRTVLAQRVEVGFSEAADEPTLSRDLVAAILSALSEMPERQAAVLLACVRLGSTDRTALAEATGETEHAVRNYLHRGRAALRSKLAAAGQGAFGLHAFRSYLRSAAHRRTLTATVLIPVLSLLTVLLRLPFEHQPASTIPEAQSGRLAATSHGLGHTPPTATATAVDRRAAAPLGAVWLKPSSTGTVRTTLGRDGLFLTNDGKVCGITSGEGTVKATRGDCGSDRSKNTNMGVWAAGTGLGVEQEFVRCTQLPIVPGLVCFDPPPKPTSSLGAATSGSVRS